MADKLSELQEKRSKLAKEIGTERDAFSANGEKWKDAEQEKRWSDINAAYDATVKELEEVRRVADIHSRAAQIKEDDERANYTPNTRTGRMPGQDDPAVRAGAKPAAPSEETRCRALSAFYRSQLGDEVTDEDVQALKACRMRGSALDINLTPASSTRMRKELQSSFAIGNSRTARSEAESRTLSAVTFASGGAFVPETFLRTLEINLLAFGGVRQAADTITTSGGERISWPTADDTSNSGALLGESASIGSSVDPSMGLIYWDAYKFTSNPVLVPHELIQDSAFDMAMMLGEMLGERLGRVTATYHTTGSGAAQPKGIVTASAAGNTTASATAITYDELIRLEHSVDPAYRNGASYMMHDSVVLALRLLKDGNGRYLWQEGIGNGQPDRLNGRPVFISMEMASSIVSGAKTILFGQLNKHKIRRAGGMRMYRMEERYRDNDQDGFVAFMREDSNTLNSGTAPIKHLLQA